MSSAGLSVRDLFGIDRIDLTPDSVGRVSDPAIYQQIGQQLHERAGATWTAIRAAVPDRLDSLLRIDVASVLVDGWNKSRELRKYRDETKYPPDDVVLVPLTRHKVGATFKPALEIVIEGVTVGRLNFEIDLAFVFEGAELTIQAGRIRKIRTGRCLGTGTIKCERAVLGQAERKLMPLPGVIDLGAGILIPAERSART